MELPTSPFLKQKISNYLKLHNFKGNSTYLIEHLNNVGCKHNINSIIIIFINKINDVHNILIKNRTHNYDESQLIECEFETVLCDINFDDVLRDILCFFEPTNDKLITLLEEINEKITNTLSSLEENNEKVTKILSSLEDTIY
jgi:hypothetical protein